MRRAFEQRRPLNAYKFKHHSQRQQPYDLNLAKILALYAPPQAPFLRIRINFFQYFH